MENQNITVNEIASCLDINYKWAPHIIHNVLKFFKVDDTLKKLKEHVNTCKALLCHFKAERDKFLKIIVTGNENWAQPWIKQVNKEWPYRSLSKPNKCCILPLAGKIMLTLFWDENEVIVEFYAQCYTENSH